MSVVTAPKKFAVVSFNNDTVEVIPASWLVNEHQTKWPDSDVFSQNTVIKYIKQCKPPEQSWGTFHGVKIYCYTKTFSTANKIANAVKESSNADSDSSENDKNTLKKRKIKKPLRYLSGSSSETENENDVLVKENIKKRKLSIPCVSTSKETFSTTNKIAIAVKESSNAGSDSSENDKNTSKKRKIRKPLRYLSGFSSEEVNEDDVPVKENIKKRKLSIPCISTSKGNSRPLNRENGKSSDLNSASKKFAVVSFNNGFIEVIPASWLINDYETKWPDSDIYSRNIVSKYIKQCKAPEQSWETFGVNIHCYTKNFLTANRVANAVKESSNVGSDSSNSDRATKKKRLIKKPHRYLNESTSEDEDYVTLKKKFKKKKFSLPCVSTSKETIRTSNGENRVIESLASSSDLNFERALVPRREDVKPKNDAPLQATLEEILKVITRIDERTKKLETLYGALHNNIMNNLSYSNLVSHVESYQLPDGIKFPLSSDKELLSFNSKLNDDQDLKKHMMCYIDIHCRGKTLSSFLNSTLKMLLMKEVANSYSRLGRKGKKSFEDVKEVFDLITAVAFLKFQSPKEEIYEKFGKVLASSSDWDKTKPEKLCNSLQKLTEINGPCSQ